MAPHASNILHYASHLIFYMVPASTVHSLGMNKGTLAQNLESRLNGSNGSVMTQLENNGDFYIEDVCSASLKAKEWKPIFQNLRIVASSFKELTIPKCRAAKGSAAR